MDKSTVKLAIEQAVEEVIYCAGKSGKISVPSLELHAIKYAFEKQFDVLDAIQIAGAAIKRCCGSREARFWGYFPA